MARRRPAGGGRLAKGFFLVIFGEGGKGGKRNTCRKQKKRGLECKMRFFYIFFLKSIFFLLGRATHQTVTARRVGAERGSRGGGRRSLLLFEFSFFKK